MTIEVGKTYPNHIGEHRKIVKFVDDESYFPYNYVDHRNWTYDEHGVYDYHDHFSGDDSYTLVGDGIATDEMSGWLDLMLSIEEALCDGTVIWSKDRFAETLLALNEYRLSVGLPPVDPERFDLFRD